MVGYDPQKRALSTREQAGVGIAASTLARVVIQPLDVIKIRFQVQYEPISRRSATSKYTNTLQAFGTILKEEGVRGLWKGHLTGQLLCLSFVPVQFVWFEFLTRHFYARLPLSLSADEKKVYSSFVCGGLAAALTTLTNHPIDVVRTRFVAQGEPRHYATIRDAVSKIYAHEGLRGFYKGLVPNILLVTPEAAVRFSIFSLLQSQSSVTATFLQLFRATTTTPKSRHAGQDNSKEDEIDRLLVSVNGALSGVVAKTLVYPFDLAKKRLQIQGFEEARKQFGKVVQITGLWHCFYTTIKKEGPLGIYKGYWPSMAKAALASSLLFYFYEEFSHLARTLKAN